MTALPITTRLLLAARQAYNIKLAGPAPNDPDDASIGWIGNPVGLVGGIDKTAAVLVGVTDTETIVAFRGTLPPNPDSPDKRQVFLDWLQDFDALLVQGADLPGFVHQGFLDELNPLWPSVSGALPAGKPIYFTGHSKGGALANLAAARWATLNPTATPPIVVTFAAAKPGDEAFQAAYDKIVPHSLRYEYQDDIVPHLPPSVAFHDVFKVVPTLADPLAKLPSAQVISVRNYASVGDLQFIDWSNAIEPFSVLLRLDRFAHLAELFLTFGFGRIIADHGIENGGGYASVLDPAPAVAAAE